MRPLLALGWLMLNAAPWAMARGALLSVLVLIMGAALLGLSGWFITATGLAGLAGIGIAFDVFRPSAAVRFLALGRAAARYGERLLTHDATLRALASLRVAVLRDRAGLDGRGLEAMRGEEALARITADVDALDGLMLRVVLPVLAGVVAHVVAFVGLGWIADWSVALVVVAGYVPAIAILLALGWRTRGPSNTAELHEQALRRRFIDMLRDRETVVMAGGLGEREATLLAIDASAREDSRAVDRLGRDAAARLAIVVAVASGAAFVAGGALLAMEAIDPAVAVIGLFVALALGETVLPLRRGFAEIGRMSGAAARVAPAARRDRTMQTRPARNNAAPVVVSGGGISFTARSGEAIAMTGPSGCGKTSLLMEIAGLAPSARVRVFGTPPGLWPEADLREAVCMVPQRSALMAGTIRDNLSIAGNAADDAMANALDAVALIETFDRRGGLDHRLGEAGEGLSGGEARRLCLARAILRQPALLLLDEPTEGLDPSTATRVLDGIRAALPQTAIVAALHRGVDHPIFSACVKV